MRPGFLFFACLLMAGGVWATETTKLSVFEQFEEQKAIILKDIKDDTVYSEIAYKDVKIVQDALGRMSVRLDGVADLTELTEEERTGLFNDQGLVNTILTMAENDSRVVCRRRGRLGTNFKTTTCETIRDRRERQEADRLAIEEFLGGTKIRSN
jgi:hypothetical protein